MGNTNSVLNFLLKSFCFVLIWWAIFFVLIRPVLFAKDSSVIALNQEAAEQSAAYSKQLDEAGKQSKVVAQQQKQLAELLARHEKLADRLDAVLTKWEKERK